LRMLSEAERETVETIAQRDDLDSQEYAQRILQALQGDANE